MGAWYLVVTGVIIGAIGQEVPEHVYSFSEAMGCFILFLVPVFWFIFAVLIDCGADPK